MRKHLIYMAKRIYTTILLALTLTFVPAMVTSASARIELSEIDTQQIKIVLNGNTLTVSGAAGKTTYIYNLVGMPVLSIKIDSAEKNIDLSNLKKVVHIVKIGNISKKINLLSR